MTPTSKKPACGSETPLSPKKSLSTPSQAGQPASRLCKSAPRLLEALKDSAALLDGISEHTPADIIDSTVRQARAAIAEAEGEA